jgi:hypothetical protein
VTAEGARGGFDNESNIIESFNLMDEEAIIWLRYMGYDPSKVSRVNAFKAKPRVKPDVICEIFDRSGALVASEKLSAKKAAGKKGFNQIDRGDVVTRYLNMWPDMPSLTVEGLRLFTGNLPPVGKSRLPTRMFFDELTKEHQLSITDFFSENKKRIVQDLLAGREPDMARWFLGRDEARDRWTLLPIEDAVEFYSKGLVGPTIRGSIQIGTLTAQRKGGDKGMPSATNLQFKFDPNLIGRLVSGSGFAK